MSLNPVLVSHTSEELLMPRLRENELYILSRPYVTINVKTPNEVHRGKGHLIMTSQRLVFIKKCDRNFHNRFSSISLPFLLMSEPIYNQPTFSMNNFQAKILPDTIEEHPFAGEGQFTIYFNKGGSNLFLHYFYIYFARNKNNAQIQCTNHNAKQPISGITKESAIVDPDDPSKVFVIQPETVSVTYDDNNDDNNNRMARAYDRHNPCTLSFLGALRAIKRFFS